MDALKKDVILLEEHATRIRTNIATYEESIRSLTDTADIPIHSDEVPIPSNDSSDGTPPKLSEVCTKDSEEIPTVCPKSIPEPVVVIPSETLPISPETLPTTSSELCAKCKKTIKPKRVRRPKSKKQLEASRKNLSLRWTRDRKKLEGISEESPVLVLEEKDELELLEPRKMVGRHVEPPPPRPPARSPFDNAF